MQNTRSHRPWRTFARTARLSLPLFVLALAGTLGLGSAVAAGPGASAQRVCSAPAPGYMACFAMVRVSQATGQVQAFAAPSGYGPADIQGAYKLPAAGAGRTVAIVDAYDLPTAESDLATYRSQFGLPPCTTANGCFRKINQNGGTTPPAANVGWGQEIALDLDMVSAACPQCKILLVEASSASMANLGTAVNQAVAQGAVAVSNSYGGSESSSNSTFDTQYFRHPGVAITASSGDSGYGTSYPASSQYVTSVGGTSLSRSTNARGWTESVWSGAGSGCSINEAKPSFQHDTGCARRTMADVSAVADPNTGVAVYDTYGSSGWMVFGGTSASSPIVASVYAMATPATAGTFPNSYPYANTSALFDVTSGTNGSCSPAYLCTGGTGYDGPTGLGTPNGVAAFGPGGPPPTNDFSISVSPASRTVTAGSSTTATVSTATTSGSAQSVSLSASGLPAGAGASFSPASVTSGGSSTVTITTSASTPAGTYTVTITGTGSSATHSTTLSLTVNGTSGCASPGQKLANPGFESGAASWTATSGVIGQWGGSGEPTHGGTWDAWLDGYGRTHTDTVSQSVTIPSGCASYTLSFWLHIDSAETTTSVQYDKLTVKLGSTTLATYSNLNKAAGYSQKSFNVAAFAGQTATLTFTGTEDSSLQTSFVLDDTALNVS